MRELAERVMRVASGLGPRYEIHQPTLAKIEAMLVEGVIEQGVVEAVNERELQAAFAAGSRWALEQEQGDTLAYGGEVMLGAFEHYLRTLRPATIEPS